MKPVFSKFCHQRPWKIQGSLGWQYNNILGEYRALELDEIDEKRKHAREEADGIVEKSPNITWADLYVFDRAVLRLQSVEVLRRRAWSMRDKYRGIAGEATYQKYLDSKPPDAEKAHEAELRIDLEILLGKFHRYYSALQQREEMVSTLIRTLGSIFLVTVIVFVFWANFNSVLGLGLPEIPLIAMVAFSGMAGAFASILQRIQKFKASTAIGQDDTLIMLSSLDYGRLGVYFALISGVVFSTALFLVFAAQLLKGPFFPAIFTPKDTTVLPFSLFASATNPVDGSEYAKLLVWSFLAGFAERMVPDVLDKIARKADSEENQKAN